jgi:hypothetical protein
MRPSIGSRAWLARTFEAFAQPQYARTFLTKQFVHVFCSLLVAACFSRFKFSLSVSDVGSRPLLSLCEYLIPALAIAISDTTSLVLWLNCHAVRFGFDLTCRAAQLRSWQLRNQPFFTFFIFSCRRRPPEATAVGIS